MDLLKFIAMLEEGGLFFSRADLLGDTYEGVFTPQSIEAYKQKFATPKSLQLLWSDTLRSVRMQSYVSCWHVSDVESAALWKLYGNTLAIRSTVGRLRQFLPDEDYDLGLVQYIDYTSSHPDIAHRTSPLFYKRLSFAHERELRAVTQTFTFEDAFKFANGQLVIELKPGPPGKYVTGDLNHLIEAVVVAPLTPQWQSELAFRVSRRLGLNVVFSSSALDMPPP